MAATRHEYVLELPDRPAVAAAGQWEATAGRAVRSTDAEALARLMLDAYSGTIDSEGEDLEGARAEVASYFAGTAAGPPRLAESIAVEIDGNIVSACLVAHRETRGVSEEPRRDSPLVAYVMTAAEHKARGFAGRALAASLDALASAGCAEVRAIITAGNEPSERLFARFGFRRIDRRPIDPAVS